MFWYRSAAATGALVGAVGVLTAGTRSDLAVGTHAQATACCAESGNISRFQRALTSTEQPDQRKWLVLTSVLILNIAGR